MLTLLVSSSSVLWAWSPVFSLVSIKNLLFENLQIHVDLTAKSILGESDMPRYWFWICWIAPFKYAVQLFMLVQYKDVDEVECISSATQLCPPPESGSDTSYVTGADILDQFDLELNEYYYGFLGLIIIFLVYRTVVLVLVRQLAVSTMNKKS